MPSVSLAVMLMLDPEAITISLLFKVPIIKEYPPRESKVSFAVPSSLETVISAVPSLTAVTLPLSSTVATSGLEEVHLIFLLPFSPLL